jgi:hypothetical protein
VAIAAGVGVVMFALVALTWNSSTLTNWVSDAAQAEFASTMTPAEAPVQIARPIKEWPVQTAQPGKEFHTARSN